MQSQVHLIPLCLLGNGVTVYGFRYPGLLNCLSWCYLTIAKNVVIATQPKNHCGNAHQYLEQGVLRTRWSCFWLSRIERRQAS
jgi:hypothetical protein